MPAFMATALTYNSPPTRLIDDNRNHIFVIQKTHIAKPPMRIQMRWSYDKSICAQKDSNDESPASTRPIIAKV